MRVSSAAGNVKEAARNLGRGLGLHLNPSTQGLHCDSYNITVIMEAQTSGHIWGMLPLPLPTLKSPPSKMKPSVQLKYILYFRNGNRIRKRKIPLLVATEVPSKEHPGEIRRCVWGK